MFLCVLVYTSYTLYTPYIHLFYFHKHCPKLFTNIIFINVGSYCKRIFYLKLVNIFTATRRTRRGLLLYMKYNSRVTSQM